MISAVLINYNEAGFLKRCLVSIKDFVDEIVVVDLGSTDQSRDVFTEYKVKVVKHKWVPYADPIRNFAIDQAKGEWILMLDPDEQVPKSLQEKLTTIINDDANKWQIVNIPFKNIFFGSWISHTNFWPDKHIRFFKKGAIKWLDRVHSYPVAVNNGRLISLPAKEEYAIVHESYKTWSQFVYKQVKYAGIESENRRINGESFSFFRLLWLPLREFLARFIKHQGYLDGVNGLFLVVILMWYHILVEWDLLTGEK